MKESKYKKPFVLSTVRRPFALLPGIGRFCKLEGCTNQLRGQKVTRISHGKIHSYYLEAPKNQEYCCTAHKKRSEYLRTKEKNAKKEIREKYDFMKNGLKTKIDLKIRYDQNLIPFRIMTVFIGDEKRQSNSLEIKITKKDNLEIWNVCEKVVRYTQSTGILPNENIHQTVNNICEKIPQAEQS